MAHCPECNASIDIPPGLTRFDRVYCQVCGAELEVLSLQPLELEAIFDFDDDAEVLEELEMGDSTTWEEDDDDW